MQKYIFDIAISEDTIINNPSHKKIKLVGNVNGEKKTIKLCGPYIGACSILKKNEQDFFQLRVESAKYKFREGDFCDNWTDVNFYHKESIPLKNVKLKVILDEDCEYKIAVLIPDNQWITLPKPLLFSKNLNLERYYNRELSLSIGEEYARYKGGIYYVPKVMCGRTEICELAPYSFPAYYPYLRFLSSSDFSINVIMKIVVEKNDEGDLLIYFATLDETSSTNISIGGGNIVDYANSVLKAVLLENSNIREVLPELGIDVIAPLKRKVKCLVNKMYSEVAERVAHLEAKDSEDQEILVNSSILQEGVAEKLRENPGKAKGPKGEDANPSEIVSKLKHDGRFKREIKGDKGDIGPEGKQGLEGNPGKDGEQGLQGKEGPKGPKGEDVNPSEIVSRLKHDGRFKREIKGEKGDAGPEGSPGRNGEPGPRGEDANPVEIVSKLKHDGRFKREIKGDKGDAGEQGPEGAPGKDGKQGLEGKVGPQGPEGKQGPKGEDANPVEIVSKLKHDGRFKREIKGDKGDAGEQGPEGNPGRNGEQGPRGEPGLQGERGLQGPKGEDANPSEIVNRLKHDGRFKRELKGEKGDAGEQGPEGKQGLEGNPGKNGEHGLEGKAGPEGKQGPRGEDANPVEIVSKLKHDGRFKRELKGDAGEQGPEGNPGRNGEPGPRGDPGQDGISPSADAVAAQLLTGEKKDTLVTEVARNEDLREAIVGNQVLKDAVTTALNSDKDFHNIVKRATIDSSTNANNAKQKFTLQKGEKLLDDVYEANIVSNNKTMATLPKIGYYMLNDQLVVRNHVTKEKVVIPEDFHFLKVVKFYNNDYKLTFCNVLGNEFFEYKKYDPQYSNVSDEYKFISLNYAKKEYNPNLSELFGHRPSFFITEGPDEPDSPGHYQADVFELTNNNKGRKMATLIDKFCYFNENDQFKCCNYHKGMECRIYDTSEINQEYRITDANSKFSLTDYDDVILHTIPELI